jgi:hypothetical protein
MSFCGKSVFQKLDQALGVDRLGQVVIEAGGEGALLVDVLAPTGNGDERQRPGLDWRSLRATS